MTGIVTKDGSDNVLKTVGYEYDVDDQRVSKTVTSTSLSAGGSSRENYYLDRNQIAFITDGNGDETFHYLYGLDVDSVLAQDNLAVNFQLSTVNYSEMVWSLADRLGSIDLLTDGDGNVLQQTTYDSFGNDLRLIRYGYTGRELDLESGLNYYRARYYDAGVGRFISVDPMGFDAGDTNLYRYVSNNSTNATDPSGKAINILGGIVGGGIIGGLYALANDIESGNFGWDTFGNVAKGAAVGAAMGALVTSGFGVAIALGASEVALTTAATAVFTGMGIFSAKNNFENNRPLTGTLDLLGVAFGANHLFPPSGSAPQLAAGSIGGRSGGAAIPSVGSLEAAAGLIGGAIGSQSKSIFQSFFAMSNGDGNDGGNSDRQLNQNLSPETSSRPIVETKLPDRVTKELHPGEMRTPKEVAQARNFFERNRVTARKWWEERTGENYPTNVKHDSHPRALKDGGDPLFIEPSFEDSNKPHSIPGPDGLTDSQRYGKLGGRPRKTTKSD